MTNTCGISFAKSDYATQSREQTDESAATAHARVVLGEGKTSAGERFSHAERSGVMTWYLQGHKEAAFIHALTVLGEKHDYEPLSNEHDGLPTRGLIPQAALEEARKVSEFHRAVLVQKPHAGHDDFAECFGESYMDLLGKHMSEGLRDRLDRERGACLKTDGDEKAISSPDDLLRALTDDQKEKAALRLLEKLAIPLGKDGFDRRACWPYENGALDPDGYARLSGAGTTMRTHRVMFFMKTGALPDVVMQVCDQPACCNPVHLKGGTQ